MLHTSLFTVSRDSCHGQQLDQLEKKFMTCQSAMQTQIDITLFWFFLGSGGVMIYFDRIEVVNILAQHEG